jgi:prepilin signal peptidase PulO-like enzyme (type II secretory pathway)
VNAILAIPIGLRLLGLAIVGAWLGSLLNLGIYQLAYAPRSISPWSAPLAAAPRRRWSDWLPVVGWLGLRRESRLHGPGFWVRPLLIELVAGLGLAGLYWWEVQLQALLPEPLAAQQMAAQQRGQLTPRGNAAAIDAMATLHLVFMAHACLIGFMIVASLIDVDERLIPDEVTVPGTLLGLLLAALLPWSLLPIMHRAPLAGLGFGPPELRFLTFTSTGAWPWPGELNGVPNLHSLAIGLGCVWLWCIGLMPRNWRTRHGFRRAWAILWTRLRRDRLTLWALAIGLIASIGIVAAWQSGGTHWQGLLSALIGMAAGGSLIWVVRIIGKAVLGREAMGFGDVTLLAMIGAFLGWQPCLVVFFLAPIAGAAIGITQLLLRRENEIRYGPFLCLAALVTIVRWSTIWESLRDVFALGWLIPATMGGCLLLMIPLLFLVRAAGNLLRR